METGESKHCAPFETFSEVQPIGYCVSLATGWLRTSSAKLSAPCVRL